QQWLKNQETNKSSEVKQVTTAKPEAKKVFKDKKSQRQEAALEREQKKLLANTLKKQETQVEKAQKELANIALAMADSDIYADTNKAKLQNLIRDQARWQETLQKAEESWLE